MSESVTLLPLPKDINTGEGAPFIKASGGTLTRGLQTLAMAAHGDLFSGRVVVSGCLCEWAEALGQSVQWCDHGLVMTVNASSLLSLLRLQGFSQPAVFPGWKTPPRIH